MVQVYDRDFFSAIKHGSSQSAMETVPVLLKLLSPRSVIDVGCGVGDWSAALLHYGVEDVLAIDGDWVEPSMLQVPRDRFMSYDLSKPLSLDRRFDVAISLEVGEHLPPESAAGFVASLTRLAPCVVFSAAIPYQGGTNHVNEQWPEYWAELFARHDYVPIDCIRRHVWNNERVNWWFAQNMLLYVDRKALNTYPGLAELAQQTDGGRLSMVHPRKYLEVSRKLEQAPYSLGLRRTATALPSMLLEKITARFSRRRTT